MSTGPSKEELEMYWQNSRQYFDELANYYKTADPVYYNKFILPYYSNPFRTSSPKSGSGAKAGLFFAFAVILLIAIAGAAVFLFVTKDQEKIVNEEKYISQPEDNKQKEVTKPDEKEINNSFPDDDFLLGAKYLAEKDYDKAEEHFKKIKPGDVHYKEAQQLLKNMKYLRKYNK